MKKSSRTGKLRPPPVRKAAARKVSVQPKAASRAPRKARPGKTQGQTELAQVVAQLAVIAETLARAAERLAEALQQYSPARRAIQRESEADTRADVSDETPGLAADPLSPEEHLEVTYEAAEEIDEPDQTTDAGDDEQGFS
jgi:hypothetical protein